MEGNHNEHFSSEKIISYLEACEDQYHFIFIEQCMTNQEEACEGVKDGYYRGQHCVFLQDFKYHLSSVPSEAYKKKMFIFGSESDGIPKQVMEHFRNKHF